VEAQFVTFLDELLKGGTTTLCSPDGKEKWTVKRKKRGRRRYHAVITATE
jgi:hypothetical protein